MMYEHNQTNGYHAMENKERRRKAYGSVAWWVGMALVIGVAAWVGAAVWASMQNSEQTAITIGPEQ